MAMNNLAYDQMTGQPVDPQMKQQNAAVYNNANAIATGQAVFGDPMARQNSVANVDPLTGMPVANQYQNSQIV